MLDTYLLLESSQDPDAEKASKSLEILLICKLQCLLCEQDIHLQMSFSGYEHSTLHVLRCRATLLSVLYVKSGIAYEIQNSARDRG